MGKVLKLREVGDPILSKKCKRLYCKKYTT